MRAGRDVRPRASSHRPCHPLPTAPGPWRSRWPGRRACLPCGVSVAQPGEGPRRQGREAPSPPVVLASVPVALPQRHAGHPRSSQRSTAGRGTPPGSPASPRTWRCSRTEGESSSPAARHPRSAQLGSYLGCLFVPRALFRQRSATSQSQPGRHQRCTPRLHVRSPPWGLGEGSNRTGICPVSPPERAKRLNLGRASTPPFLSPSLHTRGATPPTR